MTGDEMAKLLEDCHNRYVEWHEPWEARRADGTMTYANVIKRATVHDCVGIARHALHDRVEGLSDADLLTEFMVVNWAKIVK